MPKQAEVDLVMDMLDERGWTPNQSHVDVVAFARADIADVVSGWATGPTVAKVCRAQALISEAADAVISARLEIVRLSNAAGADSRGTDLDRRLNRLGGELTERVFDLDTFIAEVAALISDHKQDQEGERG